MASMLHALLTKKPKVPQFKKVDIGAEQEQAVKENTELLPSLNAFAIEFNKMSADQMLAQLERMLPGYGQLMSQGTENIQSMLRGEVPQDVENQLERKAASRGVALGYGGSEFGGNQFLRNFGLTSLQLTQQGLTSAMNWINQAAARTPTFNMASAFLPIEQRINLRAQENQFQFNRDWLRNKINSIPSGGRAALITLADNIEEIGSSVLKMYAGGAMGGMGGGGGGGSSAPAVGDAWQSMGGVPASYQSAPAAYQQSGLQFLDQGGGGFQPTWQQQPAYPAPAYGPSNNPYSGGQFPGTFG